jgi:hypothetical protein
VSVTLGYQSPASPTSTLDVLSPDGHRMIVGAGMQHRFTDRFALLVDAEGQFIVPREVDESDFDLGNGTYNMFIAAVTVHGRIFFGIRGADLRKRKAARTPEPANAPSTAPASTPDPARAPAPTVDEPAPAPAPASDVGSDPEPTQREPTPPVPPPPPPPPPPSRAFDRA